MHKCVKDVKEVVTEFSSPSLHCRPENIDFASLSKSIIVRNASQDLSIHTAPQMLSAFQRSLTDYAGGSTRPTAGWVACPSMLVEITGGELPELRTGVAVYRSGCVDCTSNIVSEWRRSIGNHRTQLKAIFQLADSESENEDESEEDHGSVLDHLQKMFAKMLTGDDNKDEDDESAVFEQLHRFFIRTLTEGCRGAMSKLAHDNAHWTALVSPDEMDRRVSDRRSPSCVMYGSGRSLTEHLRYRGVHIHHRSSTKSSVVLMTLQSSDTVSDDYKLHDNLDDLVKYSWTTEEGSIVDQAKLGIEEIERYIAAQKAVEAIDFGDSLSVLSGRD
jgi:hypothetical protein